MRFVPAILCAALIAGASPVLARPVYIPPKTGEFVAFCATRFATCRDKIWQITLQAKHGAARACPAPGGVTPKGAARTLLDWLAIHSEIFDMPIQDGVAAASRAVWNCPPPPVPRARKHQR